MERPRTKLATVLDRQGRRKDWLAEQVGVDQSLITQWTRGTRRMSYVHLPKVAAALGVAVEDIDGLDEQGAA